MESLPVRPIVWPHMPLNICIRWALENEQFLGLFDWFFSCKSPQSRNFEKLTLFLENLGKIMSRKLHETSHWKDIDNLWSSELSLQYKNCIRDFSLRSNHKFASGGYQWC